MNVFFFFRNVFFIKLFFGILTRTRFDSIQNKIFSFMPARDPNLKKYFPHNSSHPFIISNLIIIIFPPICLESVSCIYLDYIQRMDFLRAKSLAIVLTQYIQIKSYNILFYSFPFLQFVNGSEVKLFFYKSFLQYEPLLCSRTTIVLSYLFII